MFNHRAAKHPSICPLGFFSWPPPPEWPRLSVSTQSQLQAWCHSRAWHATAKELEAWEQAKGCRRNVLAAQHPGPSLLHCAAVSCCSAVQMVPELGPTHHVRK